MKGWSSLNHSILSAYTLSSNGVISMVRVISVCTAESRSCALHQTVVITERGRVIYSQCCGSGIFITDPPFYPSRIPNPGFNTSNKRGGGKQFLYYFFIATNITKIENYFISEEVKKHI
jgi:hypothetical protein